MSNLPALEHQLLGLNYLTKCPHVWHGTADVQIRLLQPGEHLEDTPDVQQVIDCLNRMDLSTSSVIQRLEEAKAIKQELRDCRERIRELDLIVKSKDAEIEDLTQAVMDLQRTAIEWERYVKSRKKTGH